MKDFIVAQPVPRSTPAPFAWRVICRGSRGELRRAETIYEPMPADIRANLEHHFTVEVIELFDHAPDDLLDIARTVALMADKLEAMSPAEREAYPSPLSSFSPLVIAARQACLDRGLTSGGMWIGVDLAAKPDETAYFIAGQKDVAGEL